MTILDGQQYCTFYVEGHYFGIRVEQVQEILRYQDMTPVPLAPSVIAGLINLRGQIVTAVDLRARLGLAERQLEDRPTNVVCLTADGAVSFLVDEIDDVVEVSEDTAEPTPPTLRGVSRALVSRVHKLEGKLLLILDADTTADVVGTERHEAA